MFQWLIKYFTKRALSKDNMTGWFPTTNNTNITVNQQTVLTLACAWRCCSVISQTIGMLPCDLFQKTNRGREKVITHPVAKLLDRPNPQQTRMAFRESVQMSLLLHGNAYVEVQRMGNGEPFALYLIDPSLVRVDVKDNEIIYTVTNTNDTLSSEDVLHFVGLGNGIVGYSPITLFAQTFGLVKGMENTSASWQANAARPSGYFATQFRPNDGQREQLTKSVEAFSGQNNAGKIPIIPTGYTFNQLSFNAEDLEFLESRKWSEVQVCQIFGVDPSFIYNLEKSAYASIEAQQIAFVRHTLAPWLTKWEQTWQRLLPEQDQENYYVEHNTKALLRGETLQRYQAYQIALQNGFLLKSEVRDYENLEFLEGSDQPVVAHAIYQPPTETPPAEASKPNG